MWASDAVRSAFRRSRSARRESSALRRVGSNRNCSISRTAEVFAEHRDQVETAWLLGSHQGIWFFHYSAVDDFVDGARMASMPCSPAPTRFLPFSSHSDSFRLSASMKAF